MQRISDNDIADILAQQKTIEYKTVADSRDNETLLAVFDCETDPFEYGRDEIAPFCVGLYIRLSDSEYDYIDFWGDDCIWKFYNFLALYPKRLKLYAHNGGRFDFLFLLKENLLNRRLKLINNSIVECGILGHTIRDSYAIIPIPLSAYKKDEFDYTLMEREVRDDYKADILHYLKADCIYLMELVAAFNDKYGDHLTIGGLAIKLLQKAHPFTRIDKATDSAIRQYYYGGRVSVFKPGLVYGDLKLYDVNSMYPYVMANREHICGAGLVCITNPKMIGSLVNIDTGWSSKPYFISFYGFNKSALPTRMKDGLSFDESTGLFHACSHELIVALKYGLVTIDKIECIWWPENTLTFDGFIEPYNAAKVEAKKSGDKIAEIFNKLIMNSSYGKLAQTSDGFMDYLLIHKDDEYDKNVTKHIIVPNLDMVEKFAADNEDDINDVFDSPDTVREYISTNSIPQWEPDTWNDSYIIYARPAENETIYDVALAASITSAARAVLLEAIITSENPVYCDTDSILCTNLPESASVKLDRAELGAWDVETRANRAIIIGKKMYALIDAPESGPPCFRKIRSKGVRLTANDFLKLARGQGVTYKPMAPTMTLDGSLVYTDRTIRAKYDGLPLPVTAL